MKEKKIPIRMCIACRQPSPKKELIRIVKNKEGEISVDTTGKAPGRGAYLCAKVECLEKAYKSKALNRALECTMTEELFEALKYVMMRREIGK